MFRKSLLLAVAALMLSACGGGGGGGTRDDNVNQGGGFTLSASSATLTAKIQTAAPAQSIQIHLTGSGAASIAAGYRQGVLPATWLDAGIRGSGNDYTLTLSVSSSGMTMALGTYTTTLTVATNDSAGGTLQARDIAVTFTLRDGVRIDPQAFAFGVAGKSPSTQTLQLTVSGPAGTTWTASCNTAWLTTPSGTHAAPGTLDFTVDSTGLRDETHEGVITLTNTRDATDTATVAVHFILQSPGLAISNVDSPGFGAVWLGGDSGFESRTIPVRLTLDTGTNAFPWTATLTTNGGGNWLRTSIASGTVSQSGTIVEISADRAQVPRGEYQGELRVTANINGGFSTASIPVRLRIEDNRLVVDADGVAFSSFPSRSVLQRTLRVYDSWDATATAWQASDDQPWLTVTPGGSVGGDVVLTANPTGLADGQYTATVTIRSDTPRVVNQQTIRVGLTVRGTDPLALIDQPGPLANALAANPVEPEVYVCGPNGSSITAYDVYSGVLLRTFPATNCGGLLVSGDGLTLFMQRHNGNTALADVFDPSTGILRTTHVLNTTTLSAMRYVRPDGHPLLVSGGEVIDLVSGERASQAQTAGVFAVSGNQRSIYTRSEFGFKDLARTTLRYSPILSSPVMLIPTAFNHGTAPTEDRGSVSDLALSSSNDRLFVAGSPPPFGEFDVLDAMDMTLRGRMPGGQGAANVETSWNGLVVNGSVMNAGTDDLWVYDAQGLERARLDSGAIPFDAILFGDAVKFSGDGTRLVSATSAGLRIQNAPAP
jgi:hypothetical protein